MDDENSNSGHSNSGHRNSGYSNSGHSNSGNWNSGHSNSGDSNSGHSNSGNWNSGHSNSGDWNSGNWNSGNWNSGNFCTETPGPTFFDAPAPEGMTWGEAADLIPWVDLPVGCRWVASCDMTDSEKAEHTNHETIGGFLRVLHRDIREAFPIAWSKLDEETRQRFLDLPNFDAEKFLAITGVDVRVVESGPKPELVVDGHRYVLA